jgi:hypothetical protein
MIIAATRRILTIIMLSGMFLFAHAQPENEPFGKIKPYRILTSGKQITVKSTKEIQSIMVWTASGHRIIEQKEVNAPSFSFSIAMNEKVFFVMLHFKGNERYTEKIGVR